jgi:prepilin-type N-terminal cleavage/methylation domain-containing protein
MGAGDQRTHLETGLTLIELMLAIAILGMVFVMLAGSFHAIAAGKVQAEGRLATNQQGRTILWEMSNEIRGAVQTANIASHLQLEGLGRMQNNAPMDSISVSTLDPGHRRTLEGFGSEDIITYAPAPNPDHRGWFLLTRTQFSSLLETGSAPSDATVILADNLLSLHYRYFDGNTWQESWESSSQPPGRQLPQAISIELALASPGGAPQRLATIVTLPMAMQQW